MDAFDIYLTMIRRVPLLTAAEETALALRMRDAALPESERRAARDRMIEGNLRLVVHWAKRYQGRGVALDELVAEGNQYLIAAVQTYDPARGVRLGTHLSHALRLQFGNYTDVDALIHVPLHQVHRIGLLDGSGPIEQGVNGEPWTARQEATLRAARAMFPRRVPGPLPRDYPAPEPLGEPADPLCRAWLDDAVAEIARADPRAAEVLRRRYPLDGAAPQTLAEIGARMGLTRQGVSYHENRALRALTKRLDPARRERSVAS